MVFITALGVKNEHLVMHENRQKSGHQDNHVLTYFNTPVGRCWVGRSSVVKPQKPKIAGTTTDDHTTGFRYHRKKLGNF